MLQSITDFISFLYQGLFAYAGNHTTASMVGVRGVGCHHCSHRCCTTGATLITYVLLPFGVVVQFFEGALAI